MTAAELKAFIRQKLVSRRTIQQELDSLDAIIDFSSPGDTSTIPAWTPAGNFNLDGSGAGRFSTHPDLVGSLRFWASKIDNNINHEPPVIPLITEDDFWKEVSPSSGSGIQVYAPGIYVAGFTIVASLAEGFPCLYYLNVDDEDRPFESENLLTELAAEQWIRVGNPTGGGGSSSDRRNVFRFNSNLFTEQQQSFRGVIDDLSGFYTNGISSVSFEAQLDTASTWTTIADLTALQTWINSNITGTESSGTVFWIKVLATYNSGVTGTEEYRLTYSAA